MASQSAGVMQVLSWQQIRDYHDSKKIIEMSITSESICLHNYITVIPKVTCPFIIQNIGSKSQYTAWICCHLRNKFVVVAFFFNCNFS